MVHCNACLSWRKNESLQFSCFVPVEPTTDHSLWAVYCQQTSCFSPPPSCGCSCGKSPNSSPRFCSRRHRVTSCFGGGCPPAHARGVRGCVSVCVCLRRVNEGGGGGGGSLLLSTANYVELLGRGESIAEDLKRIVLWAVQKCTAEIIC